MWSKLQQRDDSEHAQVVVRIVITFLFCVYFSWLVGSGDDSPQLRATWMILLAELVLSVGLLAAIVVSPAPSHLRLSLIHI